MNGSRKPAPLGGDLAWAGILVVTGLLVGLAVNALSPHGINMALALDWWPGGD